MKLALVQLDAEDDLWSIEHLPKLLLLAKEADLVVFPEGIPFAEHGRHLIALEKAQQMLECDLEHGETEIGYTPKDGTGYGLVEAPRGPLIHRYEVENGLIKSADFVIPTVHNMLAIRRALTVAAKRYVSEDGISAELERAVGRVVRAFDPCIACATK